MHNLIDTKQIVIKVTFLDLIKEMFCFIHSNRMKNIIQMLKDYIFWSENKTISVYLLKLLFSFNRIELT